MKKFTFFWLSGYKEVLEGEDTLHAFKRAGYQPSRIAEIQMTSEGVDDSCRWDGEQWIKKTEVTFPITMNFQLYPLGHITFFDLDEITKLLGSGEFTFAGQYRQDHDGGITLIGLSLIPVSSMSKLSVFDKNNWEGPLKE
jgi:hypothetical protein